MAQNLWDVIHKLVDGEPMSDPEKAQAHGLIETHLAQHLGIAGEQGRHREQLKAHDDALSAHGMLGAQASRG